MNSAITVYREGSGLPVTLIHGWGMNAAVFEPLTEVLASEFAVTRVDLPGHGQSGWTGQPDFAAQLEQLAEVLPDSAVLGWSMGGLYALKLANKYPQKFKKLMLVACNPCFVQRENWQTAVDAAVFSEFAESLISDWGATIRRFIGLQMHGVEQARRLVRQISQLLLKGGQPNPAAMQSGLQLLLDLDLRSELAGARVPVLEILGQRDTLVPVTLAQQLPLINPAIRVECVARSAHAPFLSHRDQVAGLISEFIKSPSAG